MVAEVLQTTGSSPHVQCEGACRTLVVKAAVFTPSFAVLVSDLPHQKEDDAGHDGG